jgi:hypothetical protein
MTAGTRFGAEASAVPARWLPAVALLAVAGVLSAVAPLFTLVTAADGSSTAPPVHSAWVAVLPALIALALVATGGTRALGAVFGAGAVAIGQALADLGLLVDPDSMLRPELFGVATIDAFPLTPTGWAGLPVIAELLAVVALAIAARDVLEPLDRDPVADDERPRVLRFTPGTLLGLACAVGVAVSMLGVLYASPLPVVRPLGLADIGLSGTAGAAVGAVVLAVLIVLAYAVDTAAGQGILIGAGAAAAVPPLVVLLGGSAAHPSALAWVGGVAAIALALTALLRRDPVVRAGNGTDPQVPDVAVASVTETLDEVRPTVPALGWRLLPGLLALAAAVCAALAYLRPVASSVLSSETTSFDAAGSAFLPAAVLLAVGGLLALLPPTARIGRLAVAVVWAASFSALLAAAEFVSSTIWVSSAVIVAGGVELDTGWWWGLAGTALAVVAAVVAPIVSARIRQASVDVDAFSDEPLDALRWTIGAVLSLLAVVALAQPVFRANGRPSATLFDLGSRIDGYGTWAVLIAVLGAVWIGCRPTDRVRSATLLVSAAMLAAARLVVTPAVRHQVGFEFAGGFALTLALVVALLLAAGLLWWRTPAAATPPPVSRPAPARTAVRTPARPAAKTSGGGQVNRPKPAGKGGNRTAAKPKGKRTGR